MPYNRQKGIIMFIQTEATPNPNTLKFLPGRKVYDGILEVHGAMSADMSPFAQTLFKIHGVRSLMFGDEFISVTKQPDIEWKHIKPEILGAIMDGFVSNIPIWISDEKPQKETKVFEGEAAQIVEEIQQLLETRVRPAVAQDGGDIEFQDFNMDTGVVYLQMRGACSGCPSSTLTLRHGVENMIKHYIPEVTKVEQVQL